MRNTAVILAGGSGTRIGGALPKQFLPLKDDKSVLECCVEAFEACQKIDEIIIVTLPDYVARVQESMLAQGWQKVTDIVLGGKERWESSWNAISHLVNRYDENEEVNVLLHDCARPFVSQRIIEDVVAALESHKAVSVAVPSTDTIYESMMEAGERTIKDIPSRAKMWKAQTPQAFRLSLIRKAYETALKDNDLQVTDDCGIVFQYAKGVPVYIVEGEETNRKITYKEDLK